MTLGRRLLVPAYDRPPTFSGSATKGAIFDFSCARCNNRVAISIDKLIEAAWTWEATAQRDADPALVAEAKQVFEFNLVGRSHEGGMPLLIFPRCSGCETRYVLYAGVSEPSNSWYLVTVQGISEVRA